SQWSGEETFLDRVALWSQAHVVSYMDARDAMDRTERFYKIELLLRSRSCVGFDVLQAELDVSPATLERDLQYLRHRPSAPIVYYRGENGYRFVQQSGNSARRQ